MSVFDIFRKGPERERGLRPVPPPFEILAPAGPPSGAPFEILAPPERIPLPAEIPGPPEIFRPAEPRREIPSPGIRVPPLEYLDRIFDLDRLWREIRSMRMEPGFVRAVRETVRTRAPVEATLEVLAERERGAEYAVADFLGIPEDVMDGIVSAGDDPWKEVLNPALWDLERALVRLMPDDLPGDLAFDVDEEGRFGLLYREESPEI